MKRKYMIIVLMTGALGLTGCSQGTSNSGTTGTTRSDNALISENDIAILDTEDMFTERDRNTEYDESECTAISLSDEGSKCDSDGVKIDGQTITITEGGMYLLTGSLSNGSVVIDTDKKEKVQVILKNVSIINEEGAGICVEQTDKAFITLSDGSINEIVSNSFSGNKDTNIDGAIFSREDLTLNGSGTLKLASSAHGIVSKDDLVLTGGVYQIESEKQGLSGKESVRIADGTFTITSGTDAIHSEDTDEDTKGFVYIAGGVLTLDAGGDGISSSYVVQADGGNFDISTNSTETDTSTKGIKAQKYVILKDGTYQLATADDGIHCNGNIYVCGGTYSINSGDDGIHADDQTVVLDGKIDITNCYEGIEGQSVTIQDGTIKIVSNDDGLNAAGGNDQSSMGRPGENTFQEDSDAYIDILGGTIEIDVKGDGIDSNGDLSVSGGVIYVSASGDDGNGALDYDGTAIITGGTVVAAGMNGMAQNFGSDSTQGTMLINLDTDQSGEVALKDTDGTVLVSYTPVRDFNSVVISCAELKEGADYTLTTGSESKEITMSSLIYSEGQSMQEPGQGGPGMNGQDGNPGQGGLEMNGQKGNPGQGGPGNDDFEPDSQNGSNGNGSSSGQDTSAEMPEKSFPDEQKIGSPGK